MTDTAKIRPSENQSQPSFEKTEKQQVKESKDVKEAANVGRAAYVEAVGMDESLETTGKVSEVLAGSREDDGGGVAGAKVQPVQITPALIKAQLLKNIPNEEVMRIQIEKEVHREISYLHKKAMKMIRSPGSMSYFEMNNLMRKIRELKGVLLNILKASLESLKTLWLRYVHGIM